MTARAREMAEFEQAVAAHFKKASIPTLFEWFKKSGDKNATYARIEIEEMWLGWKLARPTAERMKRCKLCGGVVDLTDAVPPTEFAGQHAKGSKP